MNEAKILIALPSFNEEQVLSNVISDLQSAFEAEILVIDDGSNDDTSTLARNHGVHVIHHTCNRGAGAASQTAIDFAKINDYHILVLMDADNQHNAEDIERIIHCILEGHSDIIIGNRFGSIINDIPKSRIVFNRIANALTNFFCKKRYQDTQSGFRALNRRSIENLDLKVDGFGFCSEMIIVGESQRLKISEMPIHVKYTTYSLSKGQSFSKGITTAFHFLWRIIFD